MKAMQIKTYGEDAKFEVAEVDKPEIKPGHVLVKIAASSVNTVDTMIRRMGKDLPLSPDTPAILGMDFSGKIEAVGDGVTNYVVGDEVYGCAGGLADLPGTLAEYMVADCDLVAKKPSNLSLREAAALPLVAITAYEGLMRAGIKAGQKVLVHGGSGGVGHVALQLAKHFGADVYSTGGGEKQLQLIEQLGATGINYKTESVEQYVVKHTDGAGFDIVFDSVVFTAAQSQRAIVFRFDQAIGLDIAVRFFGVPGNCGNSMVTNDGTRQQVDDFATPQSCFIGVRFWLRYSHWQNLEVRNGNMRLTDRPIPRPSKFWI